MLNLTPSQVAERWSCSTERVLGLIHGGHLKAFSISNPGSKRPRYRISESAVKEFEDAASTQPPPKPKRPQKKPKSDHVIEFYK